MDPVNLGRKYDSPCCAPAMSCDEKDGSRISFPSVYLENMPSDVVLPKRGRITFEYELNNISERVKDEKICYSLDILQLVSAVAKPGAKAESGAVALDKFVAKINGADESDDESSNRDEYVAE